MGIVTVIAQVVSMLHDKWARKREAVDGRARPRWLDDERRLRSQT
jgi:hypothetical protein